MPIVPDVLLDLAEGIFNTGLLEYIPVVGDIIGAYYLTVDIIDQIKNGGQSRDEWLGVLGFIPYVGDVIGGVTITQDIINDLPEGFSYSWPTTLNDPDAEIDGSEYDIFKPLPGSEITPPFTETPVPPTQEELEAFKQFLIENGRQPSDDLAEILSNQGNNRRPRRRRPRNKLPAITSQFDKKCLSVFRCYAQLNIKYV